MTRTRCRWATHEPSRGYHDREWGRPVLDDRTLFEFLVLEGAQAGLSWEIVLKRRERYRAAFAGFDPLLVARFPPQRIERLLCDPGLIRHRGKLASAVGNAKAFLQVQAEFGSFARWLWRLAGAAPITRGRRERIGLLAATLSRELRRRGFRFVGPTICHAYLQAVGILNDHEPGCWCAGPVERAGRRCQGSLKRLLADASASASG